MLFRSVISDNIKTPKLKIINCSSDWAKLWKLCGSEFDDVIKISKELNILIKSLRETYDELVEILGRTKLTRTMIKKEFGI